MAKSPKPRFIAAEAGDDWKGQEQLARLCERALLTPRQARAIRLHVAGVKGREFRDAMGLNYKACRDTLRAALKKLQTYRSLAYYTDRTRTLRDVLDCIPNRRLWDEKPQVPRLEEMSSDPLPVLPRARPFGACIEDHFPRRRAA